MHILLLRLLRKLSSIRTVEGSHRLLLVLLKKIVQFHKNNFPSARYIYTYIDIAVALFFASLSLYLSLSISLYLCFSILLQQFDGIVWLELLKDGEKQEEKSSAY